MAFSVPLNQQLIPWKVSGITVCHFSLNLTETNSDDFGLQQKKLYYLVA